MDDLIARLKARFLPDNRTLVERALISAGIVALTPPVWMMCVSVILGKDTGPNFSSIGSGVLLLGLGIGLHLYNRRPPAKRQVPEPLSDRDIADKRVMVNVFSQLHLPTIEEFLDYGKSGMIYIPALLYIDSLAEIVWRPSFYVFDSRLRHDVTSLASSLLNAVSMDEFFVQTSNENLHKFDNRRSVDLDHEAREAFDVFTRSVHEAEINLSSLIEALRQKFPDFDLGETSRKASQLSNY